MELPCVHSGVNAKFPGGWDVLIGRIWVRIHNPRSRNPVLSAVWLEDEQMAS